MNEKNKESDIASARLSVEKKEWRKDKKTARKINTYSLIIEEKVMSQSMKSILFQTEWSNLKRLMSNSKLKRVNISLK